MNQPVLIFKSPDIDFQLLFFFSLSQTAENYFYVPDLGQVPEIDVPSYLPDLPGIADDLMYSADLGPGFAPSGAVNTPIPELPSFGTEHEEGDGHRPTRSRTRTPL